MTIVTLTCIVRRLIKTCYFEFLSTYFILFSIISYFGRIISLFYQVISYLQRIICHLPILFPIFANPEVYFSSNFLLFLYFYFVKDIKLQYSAFSFCPVRSKHQSCCFTVICYVTLNYIITIKY